MKTAALLITILLVLVFFPATLAYPQLTNYVTDTANIITNEQALNELAAQIEIDTTAEIAIVTVPNLEGEDIEGYAVHLFEEAGLGKADNDNGLLILIAAEERQYRIEVGYGLEGVIPDITARKIGKSMEPYFADNNFDQGLHAGLQNINALLNGEVEVLSQQQRTKERNAAAIFVLVLFIIIIISAIMSSKGKKHAAIGGFGGGFMMGRFGGGGFGGGFGGFGGGMSGGGGFSGRF